MLQLHGQETPARVGEIRRRFGKPGHEGDQGRAPLPMWRAPPLSTAPPTGCCSMPRRRRRWPTPCPAAMRSASTGACSPTGAGTGPGCCQAGSMPGNLAEAVRVTGAPVVDVSSGVEDRPGVKSPEKIVAFLACPQAVARPRFLTSAFVTPRAESGRRRRAPRMRPIQVAHEGGPLARSRAAASPTKMSRKNGTSSKPRRAAAPCPCPCMNTRHDRHLRDGGLREVGDAGLEARRAAPARRGFPPETGSGSRLAPAPRSQAASGSPCCPP